MLSKEELKMEYEAQNRLEAEKLMKYQKYCANKSQYALVGGIAAGCLLGFGIAKSYSHKHNHQVSVFRIRNLSGIGLIIGSIGTIAGYLYARWTYTTCINNYIETMQKVAEKRYENYYDQIVYDKKR